MLSIIVPKKDGHPKDHRPLVREQKVWQLIYPLPNVNKVRPLLLYPKSAVLTFCTPKCTLK
jgi:hypothetical protein